MSSTSIPQVGDRLRSYAIERLLGRGGMGVVYRATDVRLGRPVALKLLSDELSRDEGFRARFERESRLAASIDHAHIVPVYEAGSAGGLLFLAMRYVDGGDVAESFAGRDGWSPGARWRSSASSLTRSTPPTSAASSTATSSPATR